MKRFTLAAGIIGLILCRSALAAPSPSYVNYGTVTKPPVIDAFNFINYGIFTNFSTELPFDMTHVTNFYNSGTMSGSVGFKFDTATDTTRHAAAGFSNHGRIIGVDTGIEPDVFSQTHTWFSAFSSPSSFVLINSSNLINDGTITVGTLGLARLNGNDVNLSRGALVAGHQADVENTNDFNFGRGVNVPPAYLNPLGVQDLYWGNTPPNPFNGGKMQPIIFSFVDLFTGAPEPFTPPDSVTFPGPSNLFTVYGFSLPLNGYPEFGGTAKMRADVMYYRVDQTNKYINIVFVNTNFDDTNIFADVRFSPANGFFIGSNDFNALEAVVQIGVSNSYDVISGRAVTNAFYLIDRGAISTPMILETNAASPNSISRPDCFEITTGLPIEWYFGLSNNIPYDPGLFTGDYTLATNDFGGCSGLGNRYKNNEVDYFSGSYGAQVGRNPAQGDGLTSSPTNFFLPDPFLVLADPTNQPGRIEINANRLNLTQARIRSEGLVSINCKHLAGGGTSGIDAGVLNANLASTNGALVVSNVFPAHFSRCRGNVYAWSGTWKNVETNACETNIMHFHVLVVDSHLNSVYQPSMRHLTLRAPGSAPIQINDNINVIRSCLFDTENLIFNSALTFTEKVADLTAGCMPRVKNFLNDTNGNLFVQGIAYLGFDTARGWDSITNRGIITAGAPLLKADIIDNSGTIIATNGGSITLQAGSTLNIITNVTTTVTNQLIADHDIILSGDAISISNSVIIAGTNGLGQLNITPSSLLTDFAPGFPGASGILNNYWQTTDGMVLQNKPDFGDLFGTHILAVATNFYQATFVWAGADPVANGGDAIDGFANNAVIGRLTLSRDTRSSFRFASIDGDSHAIYIDYLDLDGTALADYRNGIVIDDNMTVYFADCNADPVKLTNVYPNRLVWVSDFAGPNSSKLVPLHDSDGNIVYRYFNRALAESPAIDSDGDGTLNAYDEFPFDNIIIPVDRGPSKVQTRSLSTHNPSTNTPNYTLYTSIVGNGKVTPKLKDKNLQTGKTYQLNAIPDKGNVFLGWNGFISSTNAKISFVLNTNIVLTATFIPDPFVTLKGAYNGLFYETNGVRLESSGFFTFNLTERGVISGRLLMGAQVYPFQTKLDLNGHGQATVKTKTSILTVTLQLDVTSNHTDRVEGSVTDANWTAALLGDHAVFQARLNPAPRAGNYTMVLPGSDDAASSPVGDGFGTVNINTSGILNANGQLSDGTRFNQSVPISKNGQWPFFVSLYGGKGSLLSWVSFTPSGVFDGNLSWIKKVCRSKYYPIGFTNELTLSGSSYSPPGPRLVGLSLANPVVALVGGNLGDGVTNSVVLNSRTLAFSTTNSHLTLNINPRAGSFNGRFIHPVTGAGTTIQGILLQHENTARGFFLGTNQSGAVRLGD